jgi:hypothetical protein
MIDGVFFEVSEIYCVEVRRSFTIVSFAIFNRFTIFQLGGINFACGSPADISGV